MHTSAAGTTVYIDEGVDTPEDTFDPSGFPTTIRFTGPGLLVADIDADAA